MAGDRRPWHHVGHRVLGNPFTTFGLEWCDRCGGEVDTDTHAEHRDTLYVFKRWCLRCGKVLKCGVWENVPLLHATPNVIAAFEWVTKPEQDRR